MSMRLTGLVLLACVLACGGKSELFAESGTVGAGGSGGTPGAGGESAGAAPTDCDADSDCSALTTACRQGICSAGSCTTAPADDVTPCDDGLFCTEGDLCMSGECIGERPVICPGGNECLAAVCDEANDTCTLVPGNEGGPCDDGHPCTGWGACAMGMCLTGPVDCSALNGPCQVGVCGSSGCVAQPATNGTSCNDSNPCTHADVCSMGSCVGQPGAFVYFLEDFSDNGAGWTLGPEWAIGPALASAGAQWGNEDPGQDHSPSNDNGLAGVVLGGFPNVMGTHGFFWLESPPFNATLDPGPVVLTFYRWLNSDWDPWMTNRIEAWNGSAWVLVWESINSAPGITDAAWTFVQHDITAFKNAGMRVRFGFDIGQFGAFVVSGWNIDDVVIATGACP